MTPDPFGGGEDPFAAGTIRDQVLAQWAATPIRFREDANAEEDFALGGYRDRLVVELAQNASDAAVRAGRPGRVLFALRELEGRAVLVAANTGAPLDAAGVGALATLRASTKRPGEDTAGRFGVGFSAVLSVTDEPAVLSRTGGVRFSGPDTRALVEAAARASNDLGAELARRDGHVPILRLPFPATGEPPHGYDTAVVLPLRDRAAQELVTRLLTEAGDPLLLALPGLERIEIELPDRAPRVIAEVADRWRVLRRRGSWSPELLADRPVEERGRRGWQVTWALPRRPDGDLPTVVHAPTPTQEPLAWPALLIASFPLDTSRRRVEPGPVTDELVRQAAAAYADLLRDLARAGEPPWDLVPTGLAVGPVDGALRVALAGLVPQVPLLAAVATADPAGDPEDGGPPGAVPEGKGPRLLRPRDALVLDPPAGADLQLVAALAPMVPHLVVAPRSARAALELLAVPRTTLAELVDQLPATGDAAGWRARYAALEPLAVDPLTREALATLPVPLANGRVVRGARGLVLPPAAAEVAGALAALGVRTVHPEASHALLERLGARQVDAGRALELPEVRARALAGEDDPFGEPDPDGPASPAEAVLTLVAAAVAEGLPVPAWVGDLELPDADGEPGPAAALTLPGSLAAEVLDDGEVPPVAAELVARWGEPVLVAAGVLAEPAVLRAQEVPLDDLPDVAGEDGVQPADLDGWAEWVRFARARLRAADPAASGGPGDGEPLADAVVPELLAVRDLDLVLDGAWPRVLAWLAADPQARRAVLEPARVVLRGPEGLRRVDVPGYTAWWLRRALAPAGAWADPDADPEPARLLPAGPAAAVGLEPRLRRALGAVRSLDELDREATGAVLGRLADPELELEPATLLRIWAALSRPDVEAAPAGAAAAPAAVRVLTGGATEVVAAEQAVVVDGPDWLQRRDLGRPVLARDPQAAAVLAELLDLPLAAELAPGVVDERDALPARVPAVVAALLPTAPTTWCEHEELLVDGVEVGWWVDGEGPQAVVHACTVDDLARGLAWAAGQWQRRGAVSRVLQDPEELAEVLVEESFG